MGLKYNASGRTYDLGGPQYTNVGGGSKRLNYIASGKTYQLGLATDSTCSQYSPLVMRINGTNHYIGRSTSESYTTSNSISSTHINTRTSSGYSTQSFIYDGNYIYTIRTGDLWTIGFSNWNINHSNTANFSDTYTSSTSFSTQSYNFQSYTGLTYGEQVTFYTSRYVYTTVDNSSQQTHRSTKNVYYTTTMTNVANITVSITKSASSSSHNFV